MLEIHTAFQSCENENNTRIKDNSLSKVPEQLQTKYCNFFDINKAEQQLLHHTTDYIIKLKPNSESLYMHTYNMSSAKLQALNKYLNKALVKE